MAKAKTYFPQVPVEIAKKVAAAESDGHAADLPKTFKKSPTGHTQPIIKRMDKMKLFSRSNRSGPRKGIKASPRRDSWETK